MQDELIIHNLFKDSVERFLREDPNLRRAAKRPFTYFSPLIHNLNFKEAGVFMLTGGRQVGKTTLLKQWIAKLLTDGSITPSRIVFMVGELIRDDAQLRHEITTEEGIRAGTGAGSRRHLPQTPDGRGARGDHRAPDGRGPGEHRGRQGQKKRSAE